MLKRNCPICNQEIFYKTKSTLNQGIRRNSKCRLCTAKTTGFIDKYGTKGIKSTFLGRKHSKAAKQKISEYHLKNRYIWQTKEFREKISKLSKGSNNPMHGKSVYSVWLNKYGKEEADRKLEEYKKKQSKNSVGKNNPMYGKPAPKGSGVGWKGWYKNYFFRSLRELTFILTMEENNIKWTSAEKIRIQYICPLGRERTYSPDFLVDKELIEIKPIKLHNTPSVLLKKEAAEKYCKENSLTYKIIDVKINKKLIDNYISDIKFLGNYKEKYEKYDEKINNS